MDFSIWGGNIFLRSHLHTPGRYPGPFTNHFWWNFFLCGVLGYLTRVRGQNHWKSLVVFFTAWGTLDFFQHILESSGTNHYFSKCVFKGFCGNTFFHKKAPDLFKNWVVVSNVFIFTPIWGRFPIWLIFFKGVETTNQKTIFKVTESISCHFGLEAVNWMWTLLTDQDVLYNLGAAQWHHETLGWKTCHHHVEKREVEMLLVL